MYSQYKSLTSQKSSQSQIQKFVKNANTNELIEMFVSRLSSTEVMKMLDDIFQAFSELGNSCNDKWQKLVKAIFDGLKKAKVTSKHVDDIIGRIVIDFSMFDRAHLVKLVDYFLDRIRNNDDDFMSWKDVLPLLLERLEEEITINYRGTDVSGKDYKIATIRVICDIDWEPSILTSLTKMFIELLANVKDKAIWEMILRALTSKLMTVDPNELPPLAHQLLKLGCEHNSTLLFSTLSKYFVENYVNVSADTDTQETSESIITSKVSLKELQEVESTVLYYIYQSALDNPKGTTEYLKCLKSVVNAPEYILDTFVMSVLLLLSGLHEDQAFQILKLAILRQIQDEENQNNSAWLRRVSSGNQNTFKTINRVIDHSNKDRQLVLKGMVDFAFVLLGIDCKGGVERHLPWEYGSKILQKIARKRSDAGGTILEILVDKIVRAGSNVMQYTDCLAYMCRRLTMTVLEHQIWITTLLDHLLVIPGSAASQVLRAILPLMRVSGSIRDNLIMSLRKALYRSGTETRQMAVIGFLQLLKNLKLATLTALSQSDSLSSSNVASSSSLFTQPTLERSSRTAANPWHNTSLCREILAILRKCLSHEIEVRSHLYKELYFGIVKNEELTEYVIEMLMEHLFKYYEKDEDVVPPIIFEKCSVTQGVEVVLQEPLADLIFALQKIYLRVASKESARIDRLAVVLESLCKRMAQTDLEHMGVDGDTDLFDNMPKTQQKVLNIKLSISIYESLIAYRIASWSQASVNVGQSIIALFKGYVNMVEHLKRINKTKKGPGKGKKDKDKDKDKDGNDATIKKAGRPASIKLPQTVMDFDTITKSMILLYNTNNTYTTEDQTSSLRGRIEFHLYILYTCLQLLLNVKTLKDHNLQSCLELNKQNFYTIGQTLYKYIISDLKTVSSFNEQTAGLGLECFKECCDVICTLYPSELPSFLEATCGAQSNLGLPLQLQGLISPLKEVFIASLSEDEVEETIAQKIPINLIETISKLVQKIIFNEIKDEKMFNWLKNLAEQREDVDITVASIIFQLIIMIEERSLEYGEVLQDICVEFCTILGKTDKGEVTSTRKFQMINDTNIYVIYIAINKVLSSKLQNVNWLLGRLNAEHTALLSLEANSESNRKRIKDREQSLCRQFSFILAVFETLASAKIMPGPASEAIFKNLQKVYNFACTLIKYFKKKSTAANPAFQSVKFIPVIQGAGNALKQTVMDLILHVESSQSGGRSNDANVQRNKILKEVMVIPGVVQAIDLFNTEILLLSKKTGVDLTVYTKYDSIRDFRIKSTQLRENIEKMNVSLVVTQNNANQNEDDQTDDAEEENESRSESDESSHPSKKRRSN